MANTKIAAVAAVIVLIAAAIVVTVAVTDDENGSFTIVDGKGTEFTFDGPIDGIVSVNTNVPKAMKILGYEDKLKGISFYTSSASKDQENWNLFSPLFPDSKHMSVTNSMTAEEIVANTGVKYVVAPVSSMTVSADQEIQYNTHGIKVIRLDCNGDSTFEDFEKLIKLFNGNDSTNSKYEEYKSIYNEVKNTVKSKVTGTDIEDSFLCYMNSSKTFYNQTSVISNDIEEIYGKNALRNISGLNLSGVTNAAGEDGIREALVQLDNNSDIDKIIIRGASGTSSVSKAQTLWNDSLIKQNYSGLSAVTADEVYILDSDMMSGTLSYVGFVIYAEICGIDTGYNTSELIDDYNDKYGFTEENTGLVFKITDGVASEIVIS